MKNEHPDETGIQQFVIDKSLVNADVVEHIQHCEKCGIISEQYAILFEGIKKQENPVFDFNLAEEVMKHLPQITPDYSFGKILLYFFAFIAVPLAGAVIYLFNSYLSGLVQGFAPIGIYLIVTASISFFLFQCFDISFQYKRKVKALNFQ